MCFMLVNVHVWIILVPVTGIYGIFALSGGGFLSFRTRTGIPDGPGSVRGTWSMADDNERRRCWLPTLLVC